MTPPARLFVDTSVFLYAVGQPHPAKDSCLRIVSATAEQALHLHASVELLQEFLFHRLRRTDRATAIRQTRDVASLCTLHPFDHDIAEAMLDLVATTPIRGRDAVHAATAIAAGFDQLVTTDSDFTAIPRLRAVAPQDALSGS